MFSRREFCARAFEPVAIDVAIDVASSANIIAEQTRLEIIAKFTDHELKVIGLFEGLFEFLNLFRREDLPFFFFGKLLERLPSLIERLPGFGIRGGIGLEFLSLLGGQSQPARDAHEDFDPGDLLAILGSFLVVLFDFLFVLLAQVAEKDFLPEGQFFGVGRLALHPKTLGQLEHLVIEFRVLFLGWVAWALGGQGHDLGLEPLDF